MAIEHPDVHIYTSKEEKEKKRRKEYKVPIESEVVITVKKGEEGVLRKTDKGRVYLGEENNVVVITKKLYGRTVYIVFPVKEGEIGVRFKQ